MPALLGALLALALLLAVPAIYAQSGRNKQPVKPSTPSTGTTRPKRVTSSPDSQNQTPQQTSMPPVRLPSGTVVMDEAPPAPRPTPTPVADTSAGEEVGDEDVVRITSNLVTVPASVVDAQGLAVTDLKLEDFELRVDGQPRPISDLNRSEVPVTLALLFDNSSSLTSAREFEKQAAIKFFRSVIRPIDRAAIYSVATEVNLVQPLTNSVPALVQTVEHFGKPEGATKLLDAIVEASNYLRPYPGRKVIVIVSDGEDTLSDNTDFDAVLRRVLTADCQVYAVQTKQIEYAMLTGTAGNANVRALAAERRLQDLTAHTGGAVYTPIQTADLDAAFTQISADLAQQYILGYYPSDDRPDGRFRIISVRVATRPNMRVRARRGYYPRRSNEKVSYNTQLPAASEPVINSNQINVASRRDTSQTDLSRTDSLPSIASNSTTPNMSGSVPGRSRRIGPSEAGDDSETNGSVMAVQSVEEPIIKGNKTSVKASELSPAKPEPKSETKPAPEQTSPASNSRPPASDSTSSASNKPPAKSSSPTASASTSTSTQPAEKPISGGVLNGKAISLPKPQYPPSARSMRISGVVTVEVMLDEEGKVVSARAVDGPQFLRASAVSAARLARFSPTILSGSPVKVVGTITYTFSLAN